MWSFTVLALVGRGLGLLRYHLWVVPRFHLTSWLYSLLYTHETVWRKTCDVGVVGQHLHAGFAGQSGPFPPVPPGAYIVVESVKVQGSDGKLYELLMAPILPELIPPEAWVSPGRLCPRFPIRIPGMDPMDYRMDWAQATVACIRAVGPWERVKRIFWRTTP